MYRAEEVNARIDSFHGHPLTVAERAELFCMAREYAALLHERESTEAWVTDEAVIRIARDLEQAGWATGGDFEGDFLPDVRAALEAVAPMLAACVPDELPDVQVCQTYMGEPVSPEQVAYHEGWNDCRDAMLTAVPKHGEE